MLRRPGPGEEMRRRVRVLVGIACHFPLALAAADSRSAPDPGLLEFLGTFDERDQGGDWLEFLEGMRANAPGAVTPQPTGATAGKSDETNDIDDKKTDP